MASRRVVFLMSRLSDYMLNCLSEWTQRTNIEILVFHQAPDLAAAPYEFAIENRRITFVGIEELCAGEILQLTHTFAPDAIICFGWANQMYLTVVRQRRSGTIAVMTMDTPWLATFRQYAGTVWSRFALVRVFDYVWLPGLPQRTFARRLGFTDNQIVEGLYVANAARFNQLKSTSARRFVFIGRYVDFKGVVDLWEAFAAFDRKMKLLRPRTPRWELVCIGMGPLYEARAQHSGIQHLGFIQPKDLPEVLAPGGVFVLPSHYEPWGLVVQELALAGYPLIVSDRVGAASAFVTKENGIIFPAKDRDALERALNELAETDSETRIAMGLASRRIAANPSVDQWCRSADRFLMILDKQ